VLTENVVGQIFESLDSLNDYGFKDSLHRLVFIRIITKLIRSRSLFTGVIKYSYRCPTPYPPLSLFEFCKGLDSVEVRNCYGSLLIKCGKAYFHSFVIDMGVLFQMNKKRILELNQT
jgi:hypothetical protein